MFFKLGVLKNFAKACNFIKNRLRDRCFPMKFEHFLRTPVVAASENNEQQQLSKGFASICY